MYRVNQQVIAFVKSSILHLQVFALLGSHLLTSFGYAEEKKVSVAGTIRDQSGAPVSGATIQLEYALTGDIEQRSVTGVSDEQGRYQIPDVSLTAEENRVHSIRVAKAGFAFDGSIITSFGYAGSKKIPEDGKITIDFALEASKKVAIRLQDAEGHPVSNATLASLTVKNPRGLGVQLQPSDWKTLGLEVPTSNRDGLMKIDCLKSQDAYNLGFDHPDFARTNLWNIKPSGEVLAATLETGEEVAFKVACESNPAALKSTRIHLTISEEGGASFIALDVDDQGTCKARLADRHTSITVKHPTLIGVPFYHYQPRPSQELKFELFESARARGRVVNQETRKGVEGVQVLLAHTNAAIAFATTDKNGEFEIAGPATELTVNVGFGQNRFEVVGEPVKATLSSTTTLPDLVVVERARTPMRGQVKLPSGAPAANVLVFAGIRESHVKTDADGKFELPPSGITGRGSAPIMAVHLYEELACVVVAEHDAQDVVVELAQEGNMYGIVVDSNNSPLPNFRVNLSAQIGLSGGARMSTTLGNTYTQADGTFIFAGLSKGVVYQSAIQGKFKSSFSQQFDLKSKAYEVGSPKDRKALVVQDDLAAEAQEVSRVLPQPPQKLGPLNLSNWIGGKSLTDTELKGKKVLLCFVSSAEIDIVNQAYELYAERGLVVVGLYATSESKEQAEATLNTQEFKFPIALVDPDDSVLRTYQVDRNIGAVAYGSDGLLVRPIYSRGNELLEIRNFMLYGR